MHLLTTGIDKVHAYRRMKPHTDTVGHLGECFQVVK